MDNDNFTPPPKRPLNPEWVRQKDPYQEPPVKDFSHLLNGEPLPTPKSSHWFRWTILSLFLIGLVGGGLYIKFVGLSAAPAHQTSKKVTVVHKTTAPVPSLASYTSAGFGLTFSYPTKWTVADGNTTSLGITSPVMTLTNPAGQQFSGKVIVLVVPQGQVPPIFGTGDATAVLNSIKLKYANPTQLQRAQTYVSFLQYLSATVTGTLNALYVTGDYGYMKDQNIPRANLTALNPLVTVTFGQCSDASCANLEDASISSSSWSNPTLSTPVLGILKSFSFQ